MNHSSAECCWWGKWWQQSDNWGYNNGPRYSTCKQPPGRKHGFYIYIIYIYIIYNIYNIYIYIYNIYIVIYIVINPSHEKGGTNDRLHAANMGIFVIRRSFGMPWKSWGPWSIKDRSCSCKLLMFWRTAKINTGHMDTRINHRHGTWTKVAYIDIYIYIDILYHVTSQNHIFS